MYHQCTSLSVRIDHRPSKTEPGTGFKNLGSKGQLVFLMRRMSDAVKEAQRSLEKEKKRDTDYLIIALHSLCRGIVSRTCT